MINRLGLPAVISLAVLLMVFVWYAVSSGERAPASTDAAPVMVPATTVTDYLHAVIEAERTFYTVHVVERLQKRGAIVASQNWRTANTLPLPVQFLTEASELATRTGSPVRYRLISQWAINPENRPATDFERAGWAAVLKEPEKPYARTVGDGKDRRFEALYADRAVAQACIGCHNAHPNSPKKDFRFGDIIGAMIISIPAAP
ncbi:MAG TPA: DUF3365 domain-containing protein [Nitrospirales bacterium]|nr:DUF3365 domain-containing protein [Nitrospirales bacterium]